MNINSLNGVQDFSVLKNNKTDNAITNSSFKAQEISETTTIQTVNAQIALANYTIPQTNVSFKGNIPNEEVSDEEFEKFKNIISEGLDAPEVVEYLSNNLNSEKLELSNNKNLKMAVGNFLFKGYFCLDDKNKQKFLTDKQLTENDNIFKMQTMVILSNFDDEQIDLLNDVLKNEKLSKNQKIFNPLFAEIMFAATPKGQNKIRKQIDIIQKNENFKFPIFPACSPFLSVFGDKFQDIILSDEKFYTNDNIRNNADKISNNINTQEQLDIAMKIISQEKYTDNKILMKNIGDMIGALDKYENEDSYYLDENRLEIFCEILSNPQLRENENVIQNSTDIIKNVNNLYQKEIILKILKDKKLYENLTEISGNLVKNIYTKKNFDNLNNCLDNLDYKSAKMINEQRKKVIEHPQYYINGELVENEQKSEINKFFGENYISLITLSSVFKGETLNALLRQRFNKAQEYLDKISTFNENDIELLSKLVNAKNKENKNFNDKEKIEFVDLIYAYKQSNLKTDKIKEMSENGIVDKEQLNKNLFCTILEKFGIKDNISDDKLKDWDMRYIYLLSDTIGKDNSFTDLLRAVTLGDFDRYIHDNSNKYGQVNELTKNMLEESGLNYEKWINPSQSNNVYFNEKDKNEEQLNQITRQIKKTMEKLKELPFIQNRLENYFENGEFVIPNECLSSKEKLYSFTKSLFDKKKLGAVFEQAEKNPKNLEIAGKILNVKNDLIGHLDAISVVSDIKTTKMLNLEIKMWERNPAKDLFQGNYSTCCIGMGKGNGKFMPHYLMNTAYNMIEINDTETGETIGNALCYFVKDEQGKPCFIIDNIEINNKNKPSDETGEKLRNAITQYASNVTKEVTGNDDISIYMSGYNNDVPTDNLEHSEQNISFLGDIDCDNIYMDLYGGKIRKDEKTNKIPDMKVNLLRLK